MADQSYYYRHLTPHELSESEIKRSTILLKEGMVDGKLPPSRIKIQLLGDTGAGKTSLRKNLMGEAFDPDEPKTIGIDIHESVVDERWKSVKSGVQDYKARLLWYIAVILSEERLALKTKHYSIKVDWHMIWFHLTTFTIASVFGILYLNMSDQPNRVAIVGFLCLAVFWCFTDKISAYRLGGGFAIFMVSLDMVLENGTDIIPRDSTHSDNNIYVYYVLYVAIVSFLFGCSMGAGFRTGIGIAFCGMLAPNRSLSGSAMMEYNSVDHLILLLGSITGGMVYIVTKNAFPLFTPLKKWSSCVFSILLPIFASTFSGSFFKYTRLFAAAFIVALAMLSGLPVGRRVNAYFNISHISFLWLTTMFGCVCALACGWTFPNPMQSSLPSTIAVLSFTSMLLAEIIRKVYYNHPACVDEITANIVKYEALHRKHLPMTLGFGDFAGDEFYYDIHHAFISSKALFLLVVDIRLFQQIGDRDAALKRLIFWLHSICTHAMDPDSFIFLVGTRKNDIPEADRNNISLYLKMKLYDTNSIYCSRLVLNRKNGMPLFTIENSVRGDRDLDGLQQAIQRQIKQFMKCKFPIRWQQFYDYFVGQKTDQEGWIKICRSFWRRQKQNSECVELHRHIISFEEASNVAKEQCGIGSAEDMRAMLKYFHQSGYIIYLSEDPILSQFVILKPQLMIEAMKRIVSVPDVRHRKDPKMASSWNQLKTSGVLTRDLLEHILCNVTEEFGVLETLLQAYDFICPLGRIATPSHGFQIENYLVPSMLPNYCQVQDGQMSPHFGPYKRYYFDFGFFKPNAIFSRLVCKCMHMSRNARVFKNTASFNVDEEFSCRLELKENLPEQHFIQVDVRAVHNANPFSYLGRLNNYVEAIRKRDFSNLDYTCGVMCTYPHSHQTHDEDSLIKRKYHILPLASPKEKIDFPFAQIGSKVTRFCNDVPQEVFLGISRREENTKDDELGFVYTDLCTDKDSVTKYEELEPKMYDIYTTCSKHDDSWVKDILVRDLQVRLHNRVAVRVNAYHQPERNIIYLKSCPVHLIIISESSMDDERCSEERELSYMHHSKDKTKVIHVYIGQDKRVRNLKKMLGDSYPCVDDSEMQFFQNVQEHVSRGLSYITIVSHRA